MSQEIQLYSKLNDPLAAIDRMGTFFAKSGMFGCERVEQGQVLAMVCLSENKSPVAIMRTYHIMDGKLSKKAMAALAEFRAAGGRHKWVKTGDDGIAATGEFTLDGNTITVTYSMEDARRQGLVKDRGNWVKTPGNMLRARCSSNAVAMLAPEIFAGEGESEDLPATAAAPLDLNKATLQVVTEPAAQPVNAEKAIEAEVVQEKAATESAAPKPFKPESRFDNPKKLTIETVTEFQKLIGIENWDIVCQNLANANWFIAPNVEDISLARIKRIFSDPKGFMLKFGPK